ncbi:MAG TPA: DUF423 domain-containing protein [Saprospiraceae bacterium]|nr:DUF423 domain-containing protein [Saprospiraceae bacterium]
MNKKIVIAGLLGALGIGLGAFGAHGLKPLLSVHDLANYKTGVSYQMLHVVVLLVLSLLGAHQSKLINSAFWAFTLGIILFSGSLYLLSTHEILGLTNWKWLGPITPLGGLSLIVGWVLLMVYGLRQNTKQ